MQVLAWWGEEDTTELLIVCGVQYLACDINESPNHRWNSPEIKDSEKDKLLFQWMKKDIIFWLYFFFKEVELEDVRSQSVNLATCMQYNNVIKKTVGKNEKISHEKLFSKDNLTICYFLILSHFIWPNH